MLRKHSAGLLVALVLTLAFAGCKGKTESGDFKTQTKGGDVAPPKLHDHDLGPGPHEGKMVDVEHQFVAEITFTKDPRAIRVYILDHNTQKEATPIKAASLVLELHGENGEHQPVTLSADPQEGEADGSASQFVVEGEAIPMSIQDLDDIEGHLQVKIGDATLEVDLEHEEHGGHDEGKEHKDHDEDK